MENLSKWVAGAIVTMAFFCLVMSCEVISPGTTGVAFNRWTGSMRSISQGMTFVTPFITSVRSYPTALRTYTMVRKSGEGSDSGDDAMDIPTKEGKHIKQDISVTYNTSEEKAAVVFKSFRGADIEDIEKTFIRRTIITIAQNKAGQMSLMDLISTQRDDLQAVISTELTTELAKMGFVLDKVNLGASHLPKELEDQLSAKMAAQQNAQQAEYELQKQQTLAKAKVAEAMGTAQALVVQAESQAKANKMLNETLTSMLLESKRIDKWNGVVPTYMGGSATPLIKIPEPAKEK